MFRAQGSHLEGTDKQRTGPRGTRLRIPLPGWPFWRSTKRPLTASVSGPLLSSFLATVRAVPGAPLTGSVRFLHRRATGAAAAASLPPLPHDSAHRPRKPDRKQGKQQIVQRFHANSSITGANQSGRPASRRARPRRTAWPRPRPSATSSGARAGWSRWPQRRAYTAG